MKKKTPNWGQQGVRSKQKENKKKQKYGKHTREHRRQGQNESRRFFFEIFFRYFHYSIYKKPEF